jgi:hypothetical protein
MVWQMKDLSGRSCTPQGDRWLQHTFGVPVNSAATKCIPQCKTISGTITTLTTDSTYLDDEVDIHIDVLVLDFTRVNEEVDASGDQS